MTARDTFFMKRAIALAKEGMHKNAGGPFGAIVVRNGEIVAEGYNKVKLNHDPTAHAEVVAIREACNKLNDSELKDCTLYTSCEPCPMCLGAIYWTRLKMVYFGCSHKDAAAANFDDQFIYDEIEKNIEDRKVSFVQLGREEAIGVFKEWQAKENKTE